MTPFLRVWCALALALSIEAAPHRPRLYPNPDIVVLGIAGDSHGDLWLAAQDGLYHFDGIHYQKIQGLPVDRIRYVAVTKDDAVWIGGLNGLLRYDGKFRLVTQGDISDFWPSPDHLLVRVMKDLMRIGLDGSITQLPFRPHGKPFGIDPTGSLWQGFLNSNVVCRYAPEDLFRPRYAIDTCIPIPRDIRLTYTLPDAVGRLWIADENQAAHYAGDREVLSVDRLPGKDQWRPGPLLRGFGKQLWFIGETVYGLSDQLTFRAPEDDQRYLPTAGYEDSRGHLWVAERGKGLVEWTQDASWSRWFTEDFARQPVHTIFRNADGAVIGSTQNGLFRLEGDRWTAIPSEPRCCSFVLPEPDGTMLTAIRGVGPVRLSPSGAIVERVTAPLPFDSFRKILRDREGTLWVAYRQALFRMSAARGVLQLTPAALPRDTWGEVGTMDIKLDSKGRVWAGYRDGLARKDPSGEWKRLATDPPLAPIRSFAFDGAGDGDSIWVAYRGPGPYAHLRRDGNVWRVREYIPETESGSDDLRFLERDSRGWIWRGTMDGVYVSNGRGVEPEQWLHLNRRTGLSVDQMDDYGFFEENDTSVWLAGADGVSHIRPDSAWFTAPVDAPPPRITHLEADGVEEQSQPIRPGTAHVRKSLRLEFGSVFTSPFRDSPFTYRLTSDRSRNQGRTGSSTGMLEFADLPRGHYTLTIGYSGGGQPLTLDFQAGSSLWWLWLVPFTLSATLLLWFYRHSVPVERTRYRAAKFAFAMNQRWHHANEADQPQAKDYSGQILRGRYLVQSPISRSQFSIVYDAKDVRDGCRVAVKILKPQLTHEGRTRDKFALEIAALQSIHHPGIVSILDWWINPSGEGAIAMPFLEGPTLRTALRHGPLSRIHVASLFRQIGPALAEIHARGIVHRDLKPENILLASLPHHGQQAILLDFGAAGFRAAEDQLALTASPAGTFYYLAPERLTGHYAPASDVYALGVIALEALSGRRLFDLGAAYSSTAFDEELAKALQESLGEARAPRAAWILKPCFDPDPNGRPTDVFVWANAFAAMLDQDSFFS